MPFRYRDQEARNIRAAEERAKRSAALDASIVLKKAAAAAQSAIDGTMATWVSVPSSASDTGAAGQMAYDGSYIYVCTATDTWVRAALSTW
jgi:hypothetical protein